MEPLLEPATFTAARDWFNQKANLPTNLSARELSNNLPAQIRNQAFFSAKVANARATGTPASSNVASWRKKLASARSDMAWTPRTVGRRRSGRDAV